MKNNSYLIPKTIGLIFSIGIVLSSCSYPSKDIEKTTAIKKSDSVEVSTMTEVNTTKTNFIIVPGVSFGDILPNSSEKDLIKIFGEENVIRDSIDIGEGFHVFGTKIFHGTTDEITLTWIEGAEFEKPSHIIVNDISSRWETEQGIMIGSTLKQLEKINGGYFRMTGFGWDYAGTILEWKGGKLEKIVGTNYEKNMIIRLGEPANMKISQEEYFKLLGDQLFDSSIDLLQKMNPVVNQMVFILNR